MAVGFVTGRNGADRTSKILDLCFEESLKDDFSPIYILVPEKYTYEMEKKLSNRFENEKNIDPNFRIRVVSFSTLSRIVFTNVGGIKDRKLTTSAREVIVYKAIDKVSSELVTFKSDNLKMGFVNKVMDTIIDFKQNNLSVEDVYNMVENVDNEALKNKLHDIALVYEKYDELISNKYYDTEDVLSMFSNKLDLFNEIKGASIFVDEYFDFTNAQYEVIEKLIIYSKNIYFSLLTDLNNISSKFNIFNRINTTYVKIKEICLKNNIEILETIKLDNEEYFKSDDLKYLEKNIGNFNVKPYNLPCENIKLIKCSNAYEEIKNVAQEIVRLTLSEGYRYKDIIVCTRSLDGYIHVFNRIFKEYSINYFLDTKVDISTNPIIVLLLSVLDMKLQNYTYASVFRYLKSGLTNICYDDIFILENYVIANGIKGLKWFKDDFGKNIIHDIDNKDENTQYEKIQEIHNNAITPILNLHNKLKGRNTVTEICKYLYEFTLEIGLPTRIDEIIEDFTKKGDLYKAKEYSQIWDTFIEILDELVEFLGDEKISLEKFQNIFSTQIESIQLGIVPPSSDEVFVTTVDRMKKSNVKIAFVIGLNDGLFPQIVSDNSLISDSDCKNLLELGYNFKDNLFSTTFDEEFYIYKGFSIAKEKIYVSFCSSNLEGNSLIESRIIKKLKFIFQDLKTEIVDTNNGFKISDVFETFSRDKLYDIYISNLNKNLSDNEKYNLNEIKEYLSKYEEYKYRLENVLKAKDFEFVEENVMEYAMDLYPSNNFSISRLEKFAGCPFSFFMLYGLKAKERYSYEFSTMDYGIYTHKILDEFFNDVKDNNVDWNEVGTEYIENKITEITDKFFENKEYILGTSNKYKFLSKIINKNLSSTISLMAEQVRRGEFIPTGFESTFGYENSPNNISFNLNNGKKINLIGKIDRVDIFNSGNTDYLRVIDYKSSSKNLDLNQINAGLQLQLFVYMNALLSSNREKFKPAAILYSNVTPIIKSVEDFSALSLMDSEELYNQKLTNSKLSGFVIKDLEILKKLDITLDSENQSSKILPIKLKSKGEEIGAYTEGLSEEEFNVVSEYVLNKTKEISQEIYSGEVGAKPYRYEGKTACDYCDYRAICNFEHSNRDFRKIKKVSKSDNEKIIEEMEQQNKLKRGDNFDSKMD